jgi:hypothetical protein
MGDFMGRPAAAPHTQAGAPRRPRELVVRIRLPLVAAARDIDCEILAPTVSAPSSRIELSSALLPSPSPSPAGGSGGPHAALAALLGASGSVEAEAQAEGLQRLASGGPVQLTLRATPAALASALPLPLADVGAVGAADAAGLTAPVLHAIYVLSYTLPFPVDEEKAKAAFDKSARVLTLTIPVIPAPEVPVPAEAESEATAESEAESSADAAPSNPLIQDVTAATASSPVPPVQAAAASDAASFLAPPPPLAQPGTVPLPPSPVLVARAEQSDFPGADTYRWKEDDETVTVLIDLPWAIDPQSAAAVAYSAEVAPSASFDTDTNTLVLSVVAACEPTMARAYATAVGASIDGALPGDIRKIVPLSLPNVFRLNLTLGPLAGAIGASTCTLTTSQSSVSTIPNSIFVGFAQKNICIVFPKATRNAVWGKLLMAPAASDSGSTFAGAGTSVGNTDLHTEPIDSAPLTRAGHRDDTDEVDEPIFELDGKTGGFDLTSAPKATNSADKLVSSEKETSAAAPSSPHVTRKTDEGSKMIGAAAFDID